jgi:hypothetical protein
VLVEGVSDKVALETLAFRRNRDLAADGVSVVAVGGAQAIGRFLDLYGLGRDLGRADMERLGFYVCEADLEDELVRCLGAGVVMEVLAEHGKLGSFRTYQKQPAHRERPTEAQLRGFLTNWKVELAAPLVEALDLGRVPRPLDGVLAHVRE